jgi:hypothetical protein
MSVAEIKAQADRLSPEELSELGRFFREAALRKDPRRKEKLERALASSTWLSQEEFERRSKEKDRSGK